MLKEKWKKTKQFVKEHKIAIINTSIVIVAIVTIEEYRIHVVKDIGMRSLERELNANQFAQKILVDSIKNLDKNIPVNAYVNIPNRLKELEGLKVDKSFLMNEQNRMKTT